MGRGRGGGGGTRFIIGRLQAFEWLLTSFPEMANVERFDYNKVFYSLSLLFISFFHLQSGSSLQASTWPMKTGQK